MEAAPSDTGRRSTRTKAAVNYRETNDDDRASPLPSPPTVAASPPSRRLASIARPTPVTAAAVTAAAATATAAAPMMHAFFSPRTAMKPITAPTAAEHSAVAQAATKAAVVTAASPTAAATSAAPVALEVIDDDDDDVSPAVASASRSKSRPSRKKKDVQPAPEPATKKRKSASAPASAAPSTPTKRSAVGDAAESPIVLSVSPGAVDLTSDSPVVSAKKPEVVPTALAKPVHPFFMKPQKKEPPPPPPPAATATSPATNANMSPSTPSPVSSSLMPTKCALDGLYSLDRLPKPEFFMTHKERVQVRSAKMERDFIDSIEAEKLERLRLIQSFEQSGKKIHPFLQPKPITRTEKVHAAASAAAAITRDLSQFAHVHFTTDASSMPTFPTLFSHVPIDFEAAAADKSTVKRVEVDFGPVRGLLLHVLTPEELAALAHPLPIDQRHYTMVSIRQMYDCVASSGASSSFPASLPLWSRPQSYPRVDYLTAPAFRSSDVTTYLAQPRVQSFLKDLCEQLRVNVAGTDIPAWTFDQLLKQTRRMLIRRVHCFRAAQRDEQRRAQRTEDQRREEDGATPPPAATSASSRSDRAVSRGIRHEVAEVHHHQDEQVNHAFLARPDSLWTEQYRAFRSDEMFAGNARQRTQVRDWLQSWSLRQKNEEAPAPTPAAAPLPIAAAPAAPPKRPRRKRFEIWSDESDFEECEAYTPSYSPPPVAATPVAPVELSNTLLLVGPPSGKTSLIYACCHESDTGVIEISNSDRRSQRDVLAKCEEATQSHRLAMKTIAAGTKSMSNTMTSEPQRSSPKKAAAPPKEKEKEQSAKVKPPFGFFDSAAKKKEALAAAAAAAVPTQPMSKRDARKALFASKTKSVQVAVKGMPELLNSSDDEAAPSSAKKRKAAAADTGKDAVDAGAFFADQSAFKKTKVSTTTTTVSSSATPSVDPLAPVTAISSQSTIVFEEIDNVFHAHDKKFLHAVRALISNAKRPIILTCNEVTDEIESVLLAAQVNNGNSMAAIERIQFEEARTKELLPYIYAICIVEVGCHSAEVQSNLPTLGEVEALLAFFRNDVRKTLLALQMRLNSLPLTQMIGAENVQQAMNTSNAAAAAAMKKRLASTRLYQPHQSHHQDLILANLGLLARKEEIMTAFQVHAKSNDASTKSVVSGRAAKSVVVATLSTEAAAASHFLSQSTAFFHAQCQNLPLLHLNYLAAYMRALMTRPTSLTSSTPPVDADDIRLDSPSSSSPPSGGWFASLPVRIAVLPKTAEQMFPLHEVPLTPEMMAIQPNIDGEQTDITPTDAHSQAIVPANIPISDNAAMEISSTQLANATPTDAAPVEVTPSDATTEAPVASPSVVNAAVSELPALTPAELTSIEAVESDPSAPLVADASASSEEEEFASPAAPRSRKSKRIALDDDDDAEMGQVDVSADEADVELEPEEEVTVLPGATRLTKAQRKKLEAAERERQAAEEAAARRLKRATDALRDRQRRVVREQLIVAEEARRAASLAARRPTEVNLVHARCLDLLDNMASMADDVSAIDIFTQPADSSGMRPLRRMQRSHARFHPAIHDEATSASRDYYPLYLESILTSSAWHSLEQHHQDGIETEVDAGERDAKPVDIARQLSSLTSLKEADRKRQLAPGEEYEVEDVIRMTSETSRDMAAVNEVQTMRAMRCVTDSMHQSEVTPDAIEQVATVSTANVPSAPFHAPQVIVPPSSPPADAAHPIVIDSQESDTLSSPSPPPPPQPQPLFLTSADPTTLADASLDVRIYRHPADTTPEYRVQMSNLSWEIWDKLDSQQHAFASTAFLCDIFPALRSLIFDAIDHSPSLIESTVDADAELAAIIATGDLGRASRRLTRAARGGNKQANKLSQRWNHLSQCLSKSTELLRQLQQSPWSDRQRRPLQLEAIWPARHTL